MIEIFDSSCSRSLGQSASIRAAIDILNCLLYTSDAADE